MEVPASSYVRNAPYQTIYGHNKRVCLESNILHWDPLHGIMSFYASFHHFINVSIYMCNDDESNGKAEINVNYQPVI